MTAILDMTYYYIVVDLFCVFIIFRESTPFEQVLLRRDTIIPIGYFVVNEIALYSLSLKLTTPLKCRFLSKWSEIYKLIFLLC